MSDPNPNPAPNPSATPDWKQSFGADAATALESFKEPGEFLKSYTDMSDELKTLKGKPAYDWRKEAAGEDEKTFKLLERFTSPKDFGKAYVEAQNKIRSGELLKPLPENATPEQIAEYRASRGIPEKAEGYLEKLPDGLVIGENDKPIFESFVKGLHEMNADPKLAHYAVKWYNDFQEQAKADRADADGSHKAEREDALRKEWGEEYRANINHVGAFLDGAPKEVNEALIDARDASGRSLLNHPAMVKWLATVAREINPAHTIVPGTNGNDMRTLDDQIATEEKFMREHRPEYNKDEKRQERLRNLYAAREKLKARAA